MLLSLVNDMLDLKLIRDGQFRLNIERFNPLLAVKFVSDLFEYESDAKNTKIKYYTVAAEQLDQVFDHQARYKTLKRCNIPITLEGDELRFRQILINLVRNALKFTTCGLIRIFIAYDSLGGKLKAHVVDSGKGIKPED